MEEAAVFGKPATANKDRLVEISADGVLADSDEEAPDVGEEDSEEDEGGESENESETATDMREVWNEDCAEVCEVDYNPANDTCHNDDDDENADEPDEADEYPFIDLDGGLAAIAESDGGGGEESELEEECEFDYVGLASPQRACSSHSKRAISSPDTGKNRENQKSIRESLGGDARDAEEGQAVYEEDYDASHPRRASDEEEMRMMMRPSTSEQQDQDRSEGEPEANRQSSASARSIAPYHDRERQSMTRHADSNMDQHDDKENAPSSSSLDAAALAGSVSSPLRKSVSFASSLAADAPMPLSPSAQAAVNSLPGPSTPPCKTFVQTVHASPERLPPPDSPLSPVTPGKTERFGGGYFAEGSDYGVDAYLRLCYDMRTAPITKITTHAATLTAIDLEHRGIGNRGCVALSLFVRSNPNIARVNLGDNNLGAEGVSALMEAMVASSGVSELVLSGNNLSGCINIVADAIAAGQTLRVLDVSSSKVGDDGVSLLAEAVRESESLQSLALDQNSISDTGFSALCSTLDSNTSLKSLSVQWNGIKSMAPMASLLQSNSSLLALDLTWNKIGSPGCVTLAQALAAELSPSLLHLNLAHNEIGADACGAVARALQNNSNLKRLSMAGNLVGDQAALALLSGIGPASPLLRLDLKGCGLGGRGGVPVQVLAGEARSRWADQDNVGELRRVCPQLLGTLGPMPKAVKKKPVASKPKEWTGARKVPEPRNMSRSQSWKPGGTVPGKPEGARASVAASASSNTNATARKPSAGAGASARKAKV